MFSRLERTRVFASVASVTLLFAAVAFGQEKTEIKGDIVGRDGANVIVKTNAGDKVTVTVDDSTKVEVSHGKPFPRHTELSSTALVPGLHVHVKAEGPAGHLVAKEIKFKESNLNLANAIQAGLTPTGEDLAAAKQELQADQQELQAHQQQLQTQGSQIQANTSQNQTNEEQIQKAQDEQNALSKRFGQLDDYDMKASATVYFAVNSAQVNAKGRQNLQNLAAQAKQIGEHYLIEVAGYTDSSGTAAYNQELSDRRAAAVIAFLQQSCGVPLFRVLSPAAMGMSNPAASNETKQGKAENRRVEVKVLVSKGLATP